MRVSIPELSLVLLIDQSGPGKSQFAARHFCASEVLSLDLVRRMVADDEESDAAFEAGWGALIELAARRMRLGRLTVIDADLATAAWRQPLLQLASEHHYIPSAFLFGPSADGITGDEGFRRIFRFRSTEEAEAAEIHRYPLWSSRADESGPFDIVGSPHGRDQELVALLDNLGYRLEPRLEHPGGRKLVFLGDLVDHGPRNIDVLRLVMNAVDSGVAYAVPGNHDARLVSWLRGEQVEQDGGMAATIAEFEAAAPEFRENVETFLESSVSHYVFDQGNLVVAHAGLKESMQGRGSAAVRGFALHGETPGEPEAECAASAPAWVLDYQGSARVVYSHPSVSEPLWLNQTVNLATGAAAATGGRLTALRYPEMQVVSVPIQEREQSLAMVIE